MKKRFSGMLVAALAVAGVLGTSSKADAALLIDFDNAVLDGGEITSLGGGDYSGSGIVFDTILYRDTTGGPGGTSLTLAGLQCGSSTDSNTALSSDACHLSFNTATNTFELTAESGLYAIGADLQAYTDDTGGLIVGAGETVLLGSFLGFFNLAGDEGSLFAATGLDEKNEALLRYFGLPVDTGFQFANTEIYTNADGSIINSDLSNRVTTAVPEPTTMMLLGTGLLAAFRARRKSA